jgi:hypothetical protein
VDRSQRDGGDRATFTRDSQVTLVAETPRPVPRLLVVPGGRIKCALPAGSSTLPPRARVNARRLLLPISLQSAAARASK